MPAKKWTPEKVIEALKKRAAAGHEMTSTAIKTEDPSLHTACSTHWGSFQAAVITANLKLQKKVPDNAWTEARIIKALHDRAAQDKPYNARSVQQCSHSLYCATINKFGSFDAAVTAAGLPVRRRQRPAWTRDDVVSFLKKRTATGRSNASVAIERDDASRYNTIRKLFGSVDAALAAAGLPVEHLHLAWTHDSVLSALQEYAKRGVDMSVAGIMGENSRMIAACRAYFSTVEDAILAANLVPARRQRPNWTKAEIIDAITMRLEQGLDLHFSIMRVDVSGIVGAGIKLFDSWDNALRAAHVDPSDVTREEDGPRWGRVFEALVRELLWETHGRALEFVVRADKLKPDLYDPARDAVIDVKSGAWSQGVGDTVAAYAPYGSAVDIIYGRWRARPDEVVELPDGPRLVRFIHWSTFAEAATTPAALAAVADLKRLTATSKIPADLNHRVTWKPPSGCTRYKLRRRCERMGGITP